MDIYLVEGGKSSTKDLNIFKLDKIMESSAPKQAAYNKNEKSRDIRTTNIQAAKGTSHPTQPSQTASAPVSGPEAWTK